MNFGVRVDEVRKNIRLISESRISIYTKYFIVPHYSKNLRDTAEEQYLAEMEFLKDDYLISLMDIA